MRHKQQEQKCRLKRICMRAFRKARIFYARRQLRRSQSGIHLVRLWLPQRNLSATELLHLRNHTAYLQYIGCRVQWMQERQEMPSEYIACRSLLYEGKLVHRTALMLKAEHDEAIVLFSQRIGHPNLSESLSSALRAPLLGWELIEVS